MIKYRLINERLKINVIEELTFEFLFHVIASILDIDENCLFEFEVGTNKFVKNTSNPNEHSLDCFVVNWLTKQSTMELIHHYTDPQRIVLQIEVDDNEHEFWPLVEDQAMNQMLLEELGEIIQIEYEDLVTTIRDELTSLEITDGDFAVSLTSKYTDKRVFLVEEVLNTEDGIFFAYDQQNSQIIRYGINRGFEDNCYAHCYSGIAVIDDEEDLIVMELDHGRLINVNKLYNLQLVHDWLFGLAHLNLDEINNQQIYQINIAVHDIVTINYLSTKPKQYHLPMLEHTKCEIVDIFTYQGLVNIKSIAVTGQLDRPVFTDIAFDQTDWKEQIKSMIDELPVGAEIGLRFPQYVELSNNDIKVGLIDNLTALDVLIVDFIERQQAINEQYFVD